MPKVSRTPDLVEEEASASKQARMSNSSSPLVPQLSIHLSPQHLEETGTVTHNDSPYNAFPPLSPADSERHCLSPRVFSPAQPTCLNSKPVKASPDQEHPSCAGNVSPVSLQTVSEDVTSVFEGKKAMDTSDESVRNTCTHQSRNNLLGKDLQKEECKEHKTENSIDDSGDKKDGHDKPGPTKDAGVSDIRSEGTPQSRKETEGTTSALTGYVTLAARNGDSMLHGVVPSVLSPHQGMSLNTCFPASDGNWYQIISASLPSILSAQSLTEKGSKVSPSASSAATPSVKDSTAAAYHQPLGLLSSLSLPPTTAAALTTATATSASIVAPLSSPAPSPSDPLLSLLQQYATGTACSTDLQTSLSALHHLPTLNLAGAAVAAAATSSSHVSPRYLYTTNPRTGQLLILSSVGELAGAQSLQLQPQLPLQPVIQLQQHQLEMDTKAWKSPLHLKQCQNNFTTATTSSTTTSSELAAGKKVPKPIGVISKLLQRKLSSLGPGGKHDENLPSVAAARDLLALATPAHTQGTAGQGTVLSPLFHNSSPDVKLPSEEPVRENHNMKERRRRARIKDACDLMRQLVPGMSEKTDKATVFEFSARYIHFLKNFVGTHHDKDFLIKYSPY